MSNQLAYWCTVDSFFFLAYIVYDVDLMTMSIKGRLGRCHPVDQGRLGGCHPVDQGSSRRTSPSRSRVVLTDVTQSIKGRLDKATPGGRGLSPTPPNQVISSYIITLTFLLVEMIILIWNYRISLSAKSPCQAEWTKTDPGASPVLWWTRESGSETKKKIFGSSY